MRTRATILCILFVAPFCCGQIAGQLTLKLIEPPRNRLNATDIWNITVQNMSRAEIQLYLEGTVEEATDGRIVDGRCGLFSLKPNETKRITANTVPGGGSYTWSNKKYQESILRTNSAGSGIYTICIYAKNAEGVQLAMDCIQHTITMMSPPTLVSPSDGETIQVGQMPTFTWLPPAPTSPGMKYSLKIVEIVGSQTAVEAMQRNIPWLEQRDLSATMFQYPPSAKKLEREKKYAWKVIGGEIESEVFVFSTKSTPGACSVEIVSVIMTCDGWTSTGNPKYQVQVVFKNNMSSGVTYLGNGKTTDNNGNDSPNPTINGTYAQIYPPYDFTMTNLLPGSNVQTTIPPNGTVTISFQMVQLTPNNTFTLKVLGRSFITLDNHTTGNDCSSMKDCELPPCYCHDCENAVMTVDQVEASQVANNSHQYNIAGTLAINGMPASIQAVEIQVKSYTFASTPSSCSDGIDILQHSGVLVKPGTTINGSVPVFFNIAVANDHNVAKDVKWIIGGSGMAQPASIPFNLTVGVPAPLIGMTPECCPMTYTMCFKVIVWYGNSPNICRYCQFVFCKTFSNN